MIDFKTIPERYRRYYTYLEPVIADPLVRGYFGLVASFLLIAFFLVFALSPTIDTILALRKKIADQRATVTALDTKISNLIIAQENYSQVESLIPILETALPGVPAPQVAISQIVEFASSSGVVVTAAQFKSVPLVGDLATPPTVAEGLSSLAFSLAVTGTRDAVTRYLKELEQALRFIRFTNVTFSAAADSSQISVDAAGLTYYYVR